MEADHQNYVRNFLSDAVVEFFDAYGISCNPSDDGEALSAIPAAQMELGSIIGFRGRHVRGGLAFVAPLPLVADLLPVPADGASPDMQLRDWSAEIANQLVGRLKNKLSARSLDFDVGTPVCFRGASIRLVFLPDAEGVSLSFRTASSGVRVHLDCSIAEEVTDSELEDLRIVAEGDVLLF